MFMFTLLSGPPPRCIATADNVYAVAVVEGHSKAMLQYMCHIMDVARGDRVLLSQVVAVDFISAQQRINYRLLLESFADIAFGEGFLQALLGPVHIVVCWQKQPKQV